MEIKNIMYKKKNKKPEWNLYLPKYQIKNFNKRKEKKCNR